MCYECTAIIGWSHVTFQPAISVAGVRCEEWLQVINTPSFIPRADIWACQHLDPLALSDPWDQDSRWLWAMRGPAYMVPKSGSQEMYSPSGWAWEGVSKSRDQASLSLCPVCHSLSRGMTLLRKTEEAKSSQPPVSPSVKWVTITPTSKMELRSLLSSSSLLWYIVNME